MTGHAYLCVCIRVCTCISAYDETQGKELEATLARKSAVYIMCSENWRVWLGRAVSPRRGTGHRLIGQIMVRLICAGNMLEGLEQRMEVEGKKATKRGVQYLLDSHCLLASPGSVCSSVT